MLHSVYKVFYLCFSINMTAKINNLQFNLISYISI